MSQTAAAILTAVSKLDPTGIAPKVLDIIKTIHDKYGQMQENKEACEGLNKQVGIIGLIVKDLSKTTQVDYCRQTLEEVHKCLENCLKLIQSITPTKKGFFAKVKDFLSSDSNKELITKLTTQLRDMGDILNLALTAHTSKNVVNMMKLMSEKQKEKLPEIQKTNKELEKNVESFVKGISQVFNVSSNSNSSANANNTVNVVVNSPTAQLKDGRDSPELEIRFQHIEEQKRIYVLKRLKELFRDRDKGEKSKNFQIYNDVLENYGLQLGYKDGQHTLYVSDEPVSSTNALKEITKLISSIESSSKSTALASSPKPSNQEGVTEKKIKNEPMVTAFNQLSRLPQTSASSRQTSSLKLLGMDFKQLLALATQGDAMAQFRLGTSYLAGLNGCLKNEIKALEWYQKSAAQGNGCAQSQLGVMHQNGLGGLKKDPIQALKLFQDAFERLALLEDDVFAQNTLGAMYLSGNGVPKDYKQALVWFGKSASQGYENAQHNLGIMYMYGQGTEKDNKIACEYFQRAAIKGHPNAQSYFGLMYRNGLGIPKDEKQAFAWFEKAANQGDVLGQYNLGSMYRDGRGVPKDDRQAFAWLEKAANQGMADAQYNVGSMYMNGQGVRKDEKTACEYFQRAAIQGHSSAQSNLGFMYMNGLGVPKDDKLAFTWLEKAANQGKADAQYNVGYMYSNGRGVPKDDKQALAWLEKAANQGEVNAKAYIKSLRR